jgi:ABC-type phosphate transport system auxiliary subunit
LFVCWLQQAQDYNELEEWIRALRIATRVSTEQMLNVALTCETLQHHATLLQSELQERMGRESSIMREMSGMQMAKAKETTEEIERLRLDAENSKVLKAKFY